ncbi:peptidylprolyl isomerase [Salinispira pacifica]
MLTTTKGPVKLDVHPQWAPLGAARFRELVDSGFYSDVAFFRVLDGFVAQFGIPGDPAVAREWRSRTMKDDPVKASNRRGTVCFAMAGPNTRTTQLFINYGDNSQLDTMGFAPFAEVCEGMETVDSLFSNTAKARLEAGARTRGGSRKRVTTTSSGSFPNSTTSSPRACCSVRLKRK